MHCMIMYDLSIFIIDIEDLLSVYAFVNIQAMEINVLGAK